jgi:protein gp37
MSAETSIEWTDKTWNPIRGCALVSEGCRSCYAMKVAHRFSGPGKPYDGLTEIGPKGPRWNGKIRLVDDALTEPLHWRKPRRVFVNSMSDLFHEDVPDAFIDRVFAVMALAPQHTFQILTKRAERMRAYFAAKDEEWNDPKGRAWWGCGQAIETADEWLPIEHIRFGQSQIDQLEENPLPATWPLPNVWLGVSVENQRFADERIPLLLQTPAAIRFISAEPLLGPLEFSDVSRRSDAVEQLGQRALAGIAWVIVGGESGPGARPFRIPWARSIVKQCKAAGVACFVKQIGADPRANYYDEQAEAVVEARGEEWPDPIDWDCLRDGQPPLNADVRLPKHDRKGGEPSEWPEDLRVREFPLVSREQEQV